MFETINFRRLMLLLAVVTMLAAVPVLGGIADDKLSDDDGCEDNVVGSYTRSIERLDVLRDGSNIDRMYIVQLNLNDDGTAYQYYTGNLDFPILQGLTSPDAGSWKCKNDNKFVVTTIRGLYRPVTVTDPVSGDPVRDLGLVGHRRVTRLFEIVNADTIKRVRRAARFYLPTEDPADPNGGTLTSTPVTGELFKRVRASDDDLNLKP